MRVLATGGAGYIGSHVVAALLEAGHEATVVDNFSNSSPLAVASIAELCGHRPQCVELDLLDVDALEALLQGGDFDGVIHLAGLKAVGESVAQPLRYYEANLCGSLNLCRAMQRVGLRRLVFSSSATVYGEPQSVPVTEDAPTGATNPYGWSKYMVEQLLRDIATADAGWHTALLRYFNPVGAHPSGRLGEETRGEAANLMPRLAQVATGRLPNATIYGDDYPTPDGTGIRDYIHVWDLAIAHVRALEVLAGDTALSAGVHTWNLGTGRGYSVREVIAAFEQACSRSLPQQVLPRRPGDIAAIYADPSRAERDLGWRAKRDLVQMAQDHWRWQQGHPAGYEDG